jgi:hypothetical protein
MHTYNFNYNVTLFLFVTLAFAIFHSMLPAWVRVRDIDDVPMSLASLLYL